MSEKTASPPACLRERAQTTTNRRHYTRGLSFEQALSVLAEFCPPTVELPVEPPRGPICWRLPGGWR